MRKVGNILTAFAIGSIGLGAALALSCVSARAETLLVTWTEPSLGISASWEQSSTPTPISHSDGYDTQVPVWDFTSTGTTSVGPYTDIFWYSITGGGLFETPDFIYTIFGDAQAYSGPEAAPMFQTGTYLGIDEANGDAAATVTISEVPEISTWAMMLLLGFAGLGYAGYRRSAGSA